MARRRGDEDRKLRTREHVLADLSANYVEKQALLCGFAAHRVQFDYGIDLIVQTFNDRGEVENGWIEVQLKATDRVKVVDRGRGLSCRLARADLRHWLGEAMPVIVVLYDGQADRAYWLDVAIEFAGLPDFDIDRCPARVSVVVPLGNVLDRTGMLALARLKNERAS